MRVKVHGNKVFNAIVENEGTDEEKVVAADVDGNPLGDEPDPAKGFWSREELVQALKEAEVETS